MVGTVASPRGGREGVPIQAMRKQLYMAIANHIKAKVPAIKYIALWNEHLAEIQAGTAWPTPSLFIEFEQYQVRQLANHACQAHVGIRLHVITRTVVTPAGACDQAQAVALAYFDLLDAVHAAMATLTGQTFTTFQLTDCLTNHNHAELIESVERYVTRAVDYSAIRQASQTTVPDLTITPQD